MWVCSGLRWLQGTVCMAGTQMDRKESSFSKSRTGSDYNWWVPLVSGMALAWLGMCAPAWQYMKSATGVKSGK